MRIVERWRPTESGELVPFVTLLVNEDHDWLPRHFIIDSGSDETLMPVWMFPGPESELRHGDPTQLGGMNRNPE